MKKRGEVGEPEKSTIVDKYIRRLYDLGISLQDLRILGKIDLSEEDEKLTERELVEKILTDPSYKEEKEVITKYISEFIRADLISQQIHRRRGEALVKSNDEEKVDGGVYLYRTRQNTTSINGSDVVQVENNEYIKEVGKNEYVQMQYMPPDEFQKLVKSQNSLARYRYTVDEETEDLVIANVKTVETITVNVTDNYNTKRELESFVTTTEPINYRQFIEKYTMPYEFLITLCEITQNPEFVYHISLLARQTDIKLVVQDDTTEEKVEIREKNKYESYESRSSNATSGASKTGEKEEEIVTTVNTITTDPHLQIEYANTWSFYEEYEYTKNIESYEENKGPETETFEPGATLGNYQEAGYVTHDNPESGGYGHMTYESEKWYDTFRVETTTESKTETKVTKYNPGILKNSVEKSKQFLGLLRNETGKCSYNCYEDKKQAIKCVKEAVFDRNGINVEYRLPNSTQEDDPLRNLQSGLGMFYNLLGEGAEGNENISAEEDYESEYKVRMNGIVDHMKYLMTFPDNEDLGDYINSIDEPIEDDEYNDINVDDIIVKTDEPGALRPVSKEELYGIIMATYSGKRQAHALDILDTLITCQDTYKVNAIFVLAFADQESSIGTANTSHVRNNNWLSWNLGHKYSSPQENVETVMKNMANGGIYFTQGKITIKDIGLTYCPNTTEFPTQGDGWVINVTSKVKKMYAMLGIEIGDVSIDDNSETINIGGRTYKNYKQDSGSPWEKNSYAGGTMKSSGCSITSIAIVLSGYGQDVNPEDVRQKVGGKLADLVSVLNGYGISTSRPERALTADEIKTHLGSNKPIIVNVNGEWTSSSGHYMVLAGYKESNGEDYVYVINPGTVNSSKNGWVKLSRITNNMKTRSIFITSD